MEVKIINSYKISFYSEEEIMAYSTYGDDCDGIPLLFFHQAGQGINNKYVGLCNDIDEMLAFDIVDNQEIGDINNDDWYTYLMFYDYKNNNFSLNSAKDSFQTLSDLPYCLITKI